MLIEDAELDALDPDRRGDRPGVVRPVPGHRPRLIETPLLVPDPDATTAYRPW